MTYQGRNHAHNCLPCISQPMLRMSSWLTDSGATHHVTLDAILMTSHSDYGGPDRCMVGDGSGLKISHISSFFLSSHTADFSLKTVMHVPEISRTLLSIAQFIKDNNCSFEFHPSHFVIEDQQFKAILHNREFK